MIIREITESDAPYLTRIANEAFSDEINRGMDAFTGDYP